MAGGWEGSRKGRGLRKDWPKTVAGGWEGSRKGRGLRKDWPKTVAGGWEGSRKGRGLRKDWPKTDCGRRMGGVKEGKGAEERLAKDRLWQEDERGQGREGG